MRDEDTVMRSQQWSCTEEKAMVQTYIGAPVRRREDVRFLTGKATFVDDIKLPYMLHAAILRSTQAHARITDIDASRALAIPGVVAVFTFQDIAPYAKPIPIRLYPLAGLERFLQYPLAHEKVRYVGEPVAVAVASSPYVAEGALGPIGGRDGRQRGAQGGPAGRGTYAARPARRRRVARRAGHESGGAVHRQRR